jgi:hypothetical protein
MTKTDSTAVLDLLVPGLLGPIPLSPGSRPSSPVLDLLLSRGAETEGFADGVTPALLAIFGAEASAPYCLAADDPDRDRGGYWLHADPVHLRPDRDRLRLFDARHLGISRGEADVLVAEFNAHFAADGLRLIAPVASRWYLNVDPEPALRCEPLERVIGQPIDGFLPAGPDAPRWASLMNEAQMLLFQSSVNQRRETEGRPAVNGLWTWGGGRWRPPAIAPDLILSGQPLARGLALAAGAQTQPLPRLPGSLTGRTLAVWDRLQDAVLDADEPAWLAAAEALDRWLGPLPDALGSGALGELRLHACDGRSWRVTGKGLRRFWRKVRPLVQRLG